MRRIALILFFVLLNVQFSYSQDDIKAIGEEGFDRVGPHIRNTPLPKGFLASYRLFSPSSIHSTSRMQNSINDGKGKILRLEENEFKLKIPLILRDYTNFIMGLKYRYEEYHFDKEEDSETYFLYDELENKHLNYLSMDFYLDHKLLKRRFLSIKAGAQLIGDYNRDNIQLERFLKYSVAAVFGWKKTDDYSIGFGIYSNYIYGSPSIYPVFILNRAYGEHWALQLALPASATVHYRVDDKSIFSSGLEFDGASYNIAIEHESFNKYSAVELTRSDLLAFLTYEREIYDFVWFTLTGGYRYNAGFNLNDGNKYDSKKLIVNDIDPSPYFTLGLFITIPKKYRKDYIHQPLNDSKNEE